ncbi:MAG: hypothetical protein COA45_06255 [Zetaproteobacteria bacterium]|nr:MAG: hypothetical protein COA45_06255 [Zetaproteobacteria bacterium]
MIAELFYPKELKDIIADLRAKDDLNEGALGQFDKYITSTLKKIILINLFFSLILLHPKAGMDTGLFIIFVALVMVFSLFYEVRISMKKLFNPYNYGSFFTGTIESFGSHRGVYGMTCLFTFNGKATKSYLRRIPAGLINEKYKKGDLVLICYDPENPDRNVPFIKSLADIFYLRKEKPTVL